MLANSSDKIHIRFLKERKWIATNENNVFSKIMDSYENIQVLWGVLGAQQPYSDEHKDRQTDGRAEGSTPRSNRSLIELLYQASIHMNDGEINI